MKHTIKNYVISARWSDNPKLQTLHNNMPDKLRQDFDKWLSNIEYERFIGEGGTL